MTKINYDILRNELIYIYSEYLKDSNNKKIIKKAKRIYNLYSSANPLFDKNMQYAINLLVDIGWEIKEPSKKDIERLITKLKANIIQYDTN